jgi:hypothetical protein
VREDRSAATLLRFPLSTADQSANVPTLSTATPAASASTSTRLGDRLWEASQALSRRVNASEIATSCRNQTLPYDRILGYITSMYPIVVGFNRGLIRGAAKVDHVRESRLIKHLAEQLREEQDHNELYRRQLDKHGVDHARLYSDLEVYCARFSTSELNAFTEQTIAAAREDLENAWPGIWPDPVVPEPVLALYHQLWWTGTDPDVTLWEHFASLSAVEFMIFEVVSESVYPGLKDQPEFDRGAVTMAWWKEHARQGSEGGKRSDEEKHLEMARLALNRNEAANAVADVVAARAEDAMLLFAATAICHDAGQRGRFDVSKYRRQD